MLGSIIYCMNIKRQLRHSYIFMLLISVILILVTGLIIINIYDPIQKYVKLPKSFYKEIYSVMSNSPDKLLDSDYLENLRELSGYKKQLNIVITRDRNVVKTLGSTEVEISKRDRSSFIVSTDWDFYFLDGSPGEISLYVFDSNKISSVYLSVVLVIIIIIMILLLTNGFVSWFMTKSIIKPLHVLEKAARQVKEEDLETPIIYSGYEEYEKACDTFNEMRIQLKNSLNEKIKYEKYKQELIANISHDLTTPIAAIQGYLEGIRDGIADTPEKVDRYMNIIYHKSNIINQLVDRLFMFSKFDMGEMKYFFQRIDLDSFTKDQIEDFRYDYPSIKINYNEPEEKIYINADITHLQRVFSNIIDNAVKYSDSDYVEITININNKGSLVEVSICDNGPGISEDILPHVFDSFYRGDPARSSEKEGSGLGLSIVSQIVKAHEGSILARNLKSGGLEILITLGTDDEKNTSN